VSKEEDVVTLNFLLSQAREMVDELEEDDEEMEEDASQTDGSENERMDDCDSADEKEELEEEVVVKDDNVLVGLGMNGVGDGRTEAMRIGSSSPITLYDDGESADEDGHRTRGSSFTEDDVSNTEADAASSDEGEQAIVVNNPRFIIKRKGFIEIH